MRGEPDTRGVRAVAAAWIVGLGWPRWRAGSIVAVLLALGALPALAYASPPDPTWIPGLYDDADHDDVVVLATSVAGSVGPEPVDLRPVVAMVAATVGAPREAEHVPPASVVRLRAPPAP